MTWKIKDDERYSFNMTGYYIVGEARTNADNAITKQYGSFYMAFEIDAKTDIITDFSCVCTLDLTERFLSKVFIGHKFTEADGWLNDILTKYYGGSSRKAILAAYRDALKRYNALLLK